MKLSKIIGYIQIGVGGLTLAIQTYNAIHGLLMDWTHVSTSAAVAVGGAAIVSMAKQQDGSK
jgi:hypothetical protein